MQHLIPLVNADQATTIDANITQETNLSAYALMQSAAHCAFEIIHQRWDSSHQVYIVAGAGNNGGDGYELGLKLLSAGYRVHVFAVAAVPSKLPAQQAYEAYVAAKGEYTVVMQTPCIDATSNAIVIDALFGHGLNRPPQNIALDMIAWMNAQDCPVIALDIPSGLSANSGAIFQSAVCAKLTITFITRKIGLYTGAGCHCCGEIIYSDLDLPQQYTMPDVVTAYLMDTSQFTPLVSIRADAHKGDFGHVLVVGGDHGMGGAVRLAAEAALRCGAGIASVATRKRHVAAIISACPEAMTHAIEEPNGALDELYERANVLVIGPGLGVKTWGKKLFRHALTKPQCKVIDASALQLLAQAPEKHNHWVLTPHPGEAAQLLGVDTETIQADRIAASREIVKRFGGVCVLKGAGSIVCSTHGVAICPRGCVALATAGSGDVLSGLIAALLAQMLAQKTTGEPSDLSVALYQASIRAVYLHAWLGEAVSNGFPRSMLAHDLLAKIGEHLGKLNVYA